MLRLLLLIIILMVKQNYAVAPFFSLSPQSLQGILDSGAIKQGDLSLSPDGKYIDFGATGRIMLPAFSFPTDQFTIEAKFMLRSFGPLNSHFISDIISTADWSIPSQNKGFVVRIGGGHNYPLLPEDAYDFSEYYQRSTSVDPELRANISSAIAMGVTGTNGWNYKEFYGNKTIQLGVWHHLVAVWNGSNFSIYLNGISIDDNWRTLGLELSAYIPSPATLNIGGREIGLSDARHFDGQMEYVKFYNSSLEEKQIKKLYQENMSTNSGCIIRIKPIKPCIGEYISSNSEFAFQIDTVGSCVDLGTKSMINIQVSVDPEFKKNVVSLWVNLADFIHLKDIVKELIVAPSSLTYWRFRPEPIATAKVSNQSLVTQTLWSDPVPYFLDNNVLKISTRSINPSTFQNIPNGVSFQYHNAEPPIIQLVNLLGQNVDYNIERVETSYEITVAPLSTNQLLIVKINGEVHKTFISKL